MLDSHTRKRCTISLSMKVFNLPRAPSSDLLVAGLCSGEVSRCWGKATPLPGPFRWAVGLDDERLVFSASVASGAPLYNVHNPPHAFVEGLWNEDLVELFIMNKRGEYQEFNVSPSGAWWSCCFASYRTRSAIPPQLTPLAVASVVREDGWTTNFIVRLSELSVPLEPSSRVHVSAIVSVEGERRYLSSAPVLGIEPDFHDTRCFEAVNLCS
jgi:hypothetical protein